MASFTPKALAGNLTFYNTTSLRGEIIHKFYEAKYDIFKVWKKNIQKKLSTFLLINIPVRGGETDHL